MVLADVEAESLVPRKGFGSGRRTYNVIQATSNA